MTRAATAPFTPALEPARRWTRAHWLDAADGLLAATEPYASPGRALVRLPGPVSASGAWSDGLEGFARTFLLAAFRVRGEQGGDPHGLLERYGQGLRHGTDPSSDERWPRIPERRQAVVEAASVAIALSETRPWLWDRLDDGTRQRLVDWLADIVGTTGYRNNWIWFQTVVETFLASVGGPWDQADLDRNEEIGESLYVGDGWYSDGRGHDGRRQSFDYYAGWAWHCYPLLHARIQGRPLAERHVTRLRQYLDQAQHLVGSTGAPVLQGRSVTYRLAMLAPFWAGALAGATPLAPGATRALTAAVAGHFLEGGALDERGLLPVGWHGRCDKVRQLYTGAASPYWAAKGFLGLLLPPQDPVWTAPAEMPEAWTEERTTPLPVPGWIVSATPRDGIVRVANHGSDRLLEPTTQPHADDPFYRRLGYSNVTAPQLSPGAVATPLDSHAALLDARGTPSHRDGIERVSLAADTAVSRSRVHWLDLPHGEVDGDAATWVSMRRGPLLTTASVVRGRFEVRLAWWTPVPAFPLVPPAGSDLDRDAAWPEDPGPWTVHLGGWPLAGDRDGDVHVETDDDWVRLVRRDGTTSLVRGLLGADVVGTTRRTRADPFGVASVTPWVRGRTAARAGDVAAALVVVSGNGSPRPDRDAVADVWQVDGRQGPAVKVAWRDGRVDTVPTSVGEVG